MALTKYKLGKLIEKLDNKNSDLEYGVEYARGVSNDKELMPTKADLNGRDLKKFSIIYPGDFVYNHRTSRHGDKFCIAYNTTQDNVICTEDYTIFRIKDDCKSKLLNEWLYMYFHRPEMDRFIMYSSWGSSTEFFNWDDVCDIDIDIPPLPIQKKYVDIYKTMVANQQSYERGLEDLKLACDGYFDVAKKKKTMPLGDLIESVDSRNKSNLYSDEDVKGITNNKEFSETRADVSSVDLSKFKIVEPNHFAYNSRTDGRDMLVLALNREVKPVIVTFNYNTFKVRDDMKSIIDSEYLYAFFKRSEFDRKVRFSSWGSSQELLSWDNLCAFSVPVPNIKEQQSIAQIMNVYINRKKINKQLKAQIKDICPILIRGSLEEGAR